MNAALRSEIAADPAKRGYAGKTAQQQADMVNAAYTTQNAAVTANVPVKAVASYLLAHGLMGPMRRFLAAPPAGMPQTLIDGLTDLMEMITSQEVDAIGMANADTAGRVAQVLGGAVQVGLMSVQNRADLMALAVQTPAPTEHHARVMDVLLGIPDAPNAVTADDVNGAN